MAFEEDEEELDMVRKRKPVNSSVPSMFDKNKVAKPTKEQFTQEVENQVAKEISNKEKAMEFSKSFRFTINDKTLKQNKTMLNNEFEESLVRDMVSLAVDINNDPDEQEGMGSLAWITLLLKGMIWYRDRLNSSEYELEQLKAQVKSLMDKNKP